MDDVPDPLDQHYIWGPFLRTSIMGLTYIHDRGLNRRKARYVPRGVFIGRGLTLARKWHLISPAIGDGQMKFLVRLGACRTVPRFPASSVGRILWRLLVALTDNSGRHTYKEIIQLSMIFQ